MKKSLKFVFAFLFISITLNNTHAQGVTPLTYIVNAKNFTFLDTITGSNPNVTGNWNIIEFDIYIQQTNVPANDDEKMRFALGQYYININFGGLSPADTVGGYASFSYIPGSTTFSNLYALPTGAKCVAIAPSSDLGAKWNGILGGYLNLFSNDPLGSLSNVQISNVSPGTKVGRYKLRKNVTAASPSPFFPLAYPQFRWRIAPASIPNNPNPVSKIFAYNGLGGASTDVTSKGTFILDSKLLLLNLTVLMEGFYYPLFNQMARKDTVRVYIRNAESPYSIVDSAIGRIDSINFSGAFRFSNVSAGSYYIVVKHFNCIDVWSKEGGFTTNDSTISSYDFTTSSSKAYGNNLVQKGTKFCLYSGNVNQDGIIDASDISIVANDIRAGLSGHVSSDINGDSYVDASDMSIVDNNKDLGVLVVRP